MSELYERIEQLCKSRNINVTTMCKETGASRGSLTDLKSGRKQNLSIETLSKIALYFGVSVDFLTGIEGSLMFYDRFKLLCDQRGVSCNKAAFDIGLSNATPTKWKKTGATPTGDTLDRIAAYFGVTTDYLLGKEEKKENTPSSNLDEANLDEELIRLLCQVKSPRQQQRLKDFLLGLSAAQEDQVSADK